MARKAAVKTEFTDSQQSSDNKPWQFKPGQSGNPAGRPAGARNKLSESFIVGLADHFAEHGQEALNRCLEENPTGYLTIIARIVPRQIEAAVEVTDRISVHELSADQRERIAQSWLVSQQNDLPAMASETSGSGLDSGFETAAVH